jgi:hypothetical protein
VRTVFGRAAKVALSIIPCPVGGVAVSCFKLISLFAITGVILANLFKSVFIFETGSLLW